MTRAEQSDGRSYFLLRSGLPLDLEELRMRLRLLNMGYLAIHHPDLPQARPTPGPERSLS